jgi:hypothetical protein
MAKSRRRRNGKHKSSRKRGGMPTPPPPDSQHNNKPSQLPVKGPEFKPQRPEFNPQQPPQWKCQIGRAMDNGQCVPFALYTPIHIDHKEERLTSAFVQFDELAVRLQSESIKKLGENGRGEMHVYIVGPDPNLELNGEHIIMKSRVSKKPYYIKTNKIQDYNNEWGYYFFKSPIEFSVESEFPILPRDPNETKMYKVDG